INALDLASINAAIKALNNYKTLLVIIQSLDSINAAIKALNNYKKGLEDKVKKFAARLAEIGREGAEGRFSPGNVIYDGTNDVVVTAEEVGGGWVINADGKAVCFIEFGTGKFYQDTNRTYGGTCKAPDEPIAPQSDWAHS
ncbi:MAG: hypothetical protein IIW98_00005, partial [Bacteroidaceae bacterium]|nr:hypothetical protein [Bacteroidaceae bacterium]